MTYSAYPKVPSGYSIPKQAYVKGDGNLYVPARFGKNSAFLNAGASFPNFGSLMPGMIGYYLPSKGSIRTGSVINRLINLAPSTLAGRTGDIIEGSAGVGVGSVGSSLKGNFAILGNGTTQYGTWTGGALTGVAPSAANVNFFALHRSLSTPAHQQFFQGSNSFSTTVLQLSGLTTWEAYGGVALDTALVSTSWGITYQSFTGGATSINKWGSTAVVTGDAGNTPGAVTRGFFGSETGTVLANHECGLFLVGVSPKATFLAAIPTLIAAVNSVFNSPGTPILQ